MPEEKDVEKMLRRIENKDQGISRRGKTLKSGRGNKNEGVDDKKE
jgi:hypothetical protein